MTTSTHQEAIEVFGALNAEDRKVPWSERRKLIVEHFPSVERLDWVEVFRQDPSIMGRIINDILRLDAAEPGKPGKRPGLARGDVEQRLEKLFGSRFSDRPFPKAFKSLIGDRSIRHVASKTGLNRNTVHRLLKGEQIPDEYEMEEIAKAFDINPAYFAEYRLAYVVGFIYSRLAVNPEATIVQYKKIQDQKKAVR